MCKSIFHVESRIGKIFMDSARYNGRRAAEVNRLCELLPNARMLKKIKISSKTL